MLVYGIGNPLIDIIYEAEDKDLQVLKVDRGIMHLVDEDRRDLILAHFAGKMASYAPGGDCPNTMVNLRILGISTVLSGKVGNDDYGRVYEDRLKTCGVESDLSRGEGKTGSSIILVSPDGERTMNTYLGMCREYREEDVRHHHIAEADLLYFTGYLWDTPNQKQALSFALSVAEAHNKLIAFDVADPFAVGRYREDFLWILERHVDIAFANAEEVRILFGKQDLEECAAELGKLVPVFAIKDGSRGSLVGVQGSLLRVPACSVTVKDSTGAGDTYAAGFLYGLLCAFEGCRETDIQEIGIDKVREAAAMASYVASRIITRYGAQLMPSEAEEIQADFKAGKHRLA